MKDERDKELSPQADGFSAEAGSPDAPPGLPASLFDMTLAREFFSHFLEDEGLQAFLLKGISRGVIEREMQRRGMVEPLMSAQQLADVLGLKAQGLYKKLQHSELDIPYVPIGQGGGYKFDPRDVREFIRRRKVHPVCKPINLKRRAL